VKNKKEESSNKLNIQPESIAIQMECLNIPIKFKQSNRSADFIEGEEDMSGKYIRQGQVMHSLFSMIKTPKDVPSAIARLRMEGIIESEAHERQILKLVNWALKNPKVKEWFSGEWSVYNECTILYQGKEKLETKIPDRVMMKDGQVVVVDFKFGKPDPEYNKQVGEYMKLLQDMGYTQVSGYLWYVFYNQLEEIK
jgi:hypothetical protein